MKSIKSKKEKYKIKKKEEKYKIKKKEEKYKIKKKKQKNSCNSFLVDSLYHSLSFIPKFPVHLESSSSSSFLPPVHTLSALLLAWHVVLCAREAVYVWRWLVMYYSISLFLFLYFIKKPISRAKNFNLCVGTPGSQLTVLWLHVRGQSSIVTFLLYQLQNVDGICIAFGLWLWYMVQPLDNMVPNVQYK